MHADFTFIVPGKLVDGDLELALVSKKPFDPVKKYVPCYEFEMQNTSRACKIGTIKLRIGSARTLRYPGHIGYAVDKKYRGHRYAARSCRLLFSLAHTHGLKALWITCNPKNMASRKTCELAGAKYVETVRIPKNHEMYKQGRRYCCRYRIDFNKALLNP